MKKEKERDDTMRTQKQYILAEEQTRLADLMILTDLHRYETKQEQVYYNGGILFKVCEHEKSVVLTHFLPKKEAKFLFYKLLHEPLEEMREKKEVQSIFRHFGEKREGNKNKECLNFQYAKRNTLYELDLTQGDLQSVNGKKERVSITLPLETWKTIALECLDYIRHEECVAQLQEKPLYDEVLVKQTLNENLKQEEDVPDPINLLNQLKNVVHDYVQEAKNIPLSSEQLQQMIHEYEQLQPYMEALKAINQLR